MNTKNKTARRVVALIMAIVLSASLLVAVTAFASETSNTEEVQANEARTLNVVIKCDGEEIKTITNETIDKNFVMSKGFVLGEDDYLAKHLRDNTLNVNVVRVKYETVTEKVEVKSTEIALYNDQMYQGEKNVKKKGQDGLSEITYKIRYENGESVSKVQLSEKVIKIATDSVVEVGTKAKDPHHKKISSAVIDETDGVIYTNNGEELRYTRTIDVTATAYSPASCGKAPSHPAYGITATGLRATYGIIAVDPRIIPLGSKVFITAPDGSWTYGTAIAADTGGAIKGHIIDLCYDTNAECFQFGRRRAKVYILAE